MNTVSPQDLQRDPLGYLRRVEAGESFLVTRDDRPVVEWRPRVRPRARSVWPLARSQSRRTSTPRSPKMFYRGDVLAFAVPVLPAS